MPRWSGSTAGGCAIKADDRRSLPGIRVIDQLGPTRLLRALTIVVLVVVWAPLLANPHRTSPIVAADPSDIGSDPSNYLAAGLRVATGRPLYDLNPGDRPVLVDDPPYFSAPLLSPPPIAAVWRILAVLPDGPLMYAWWLAGAVLVTLTVAVLAVRAPPVGLVALIILSVSVALIAGSGNLNAFLVPLIPLVWIASELHPASRRWLVTFGALAGLAAGLKLTPVFLVWWLLCRRRWAAVGAAVVAGVFLLAASVAIVGVSAFADYLSISGTTTAIGAQPFSVTRLLALLGIGGPIATAGPVLVGVVAGVAMLLLRDRPAPSFVIAVLAVVFASPVVRIESLGLIVGGIAPIVWPSVATVGSARMSLRARWLSGPSAWVTTIGAASLVVIVSSLWATRGPTSSMVIRNESDRPVLVRFGGLFGTAGFQLDARSSGTAWATVPGGLDGYVFAFDSHCAAIGVTDLLRIDGPTVVVVSDRLAVRPAEAGPTTAPFLPYTHLCADQARP